MDVWATPEKVASVQAAPATRVLDDVPILALDPSGSALAGVGAVRVLEALDDNEAAGLDGTLGRLAAGSVVLVRVRG